VSSHLTPQVMRSQVPVRSRTSHVRNTPLSVSHGACCPCSVAALSQVLEHPEIVKGKRVCDLGAGLGESLDGDVLYTDCTAYCILSVQFGHC